MPGYKKLYLKAFNALTDADKFLQQASVIIQKARVDCEDLYIKAQDTPLSLVSADEIPLEDGSPLPSQQA